MRTLKGQKDVYKGVTFDLETVKPPFESVQEFKEVITNTLEAYKQKGIRGVWLRIPTTQARYIPEAVDLEFTFHHAEPTYVMMTKWLPELDVDPNKLPIHCQHYIGSGGAVVDLERQEILLITERTERTPNTSGKDWWKIPGGTLDDPNENIGDCAVREVFEETGVRCEFVAILAFRHLHNYRFGKSDIYFICLMKPLSREINKDDHEIDKCQWTPLSEYFAMDHLRRVQMSAKEAVQRYLADNTKCLTTTDVSYGNSKGVVYSA